MTINPGPGALSSTSSQVLEENGGRHDVQRALGHARNANRFRCLGDFVKIQTAANGFQVLGRNDNLWDQGALFILQNSTYLAPHGIVNIALAVLNESGAAVVAVEAAGLAAAPQLDVIALLDAEGATLVVRAVNFGAQGVTANVSFLGCAVAAGGAQASVVVVAGSSMSEQNTPDAPLNVAPTFSQFRVGGGSPPPTFPFEFEAFSVTSIAVACSPGAPAAELALWSESADPPSTCAVTSSPQNISWSGQVWESYNSASWVATSSQISVLCGASDGNCYDEIISVDSLLLVNGSASIDITFPDEATAGDDDAGLLLRARSAGAGPGADSFDAFEVSLGPNTNGAGSGFLLVGAHWLPGNFALLKQVSLDVPKGVPHTLTARVSALPSGAVSLDVFVNAAFVATVVDTQHSATISGSQVGLRAFYSSASFEKFSVSSGAAHVI